MVQFKNNKFEALINFGSKVNAIILTYITKLDLKIWLINIRTQTINGSTFQTFRIILANFQIENKLNQAQYFQKTFLLIDTNIEIILRILFFTFSNTNI